MPLVFVEGRFEDTDKGIVVLSFGVPSVPSLDHGPVGEKTALSFHGG